MMVLGLSRLAALDLIFDRKSYGLHARSWMNLSLMKTTLYSPGASQNTEVLANSVFS